MSPTLLEFAVAIVLLVVAWQLGVAIAPEIFRLLGHLKRDIDGTAADQPNNQPFDHIADEDVPSPQPHRKDHTNGTHR